VLVSEGGDEFVQDLQRDFVSRKKGREEEKTDVIDVESVENRLLRKLLQVVQVQLIGELVDTMRTCRLDGGDGCCSFREEEVPTRLWRVFLVLVELDEKGGCRRGKVDGVGVEVEEHGAVSSVAVGVEGRLRRIEKGRKRNAPEVNDVDDGFPIVLSILWKRSHIDVDERNRFYPVSRKPFEGVVVAGAEPRVRRVVAGLKE
jgi:hypothetical protein